MTSLGAAGERCPVCGTFSVYTDGFAACSLTCAIQRVEQRRHELSMPFETALAVVAREFRAWGLPVEPAPEDRFRYRYVKVCEKFTSRYWRIDRALLLEAGLNVEYAWVGNGATRSRVYRFSPKALQQLPEFMHDYPVRSFSDDEMRYLQSVWNPYWHFLPIPSNP